MIWKPKPISLISFLAWPNKKQRIKIFKILNHNDDPHKVCYYFYVYLHDWTYFCFKKLIGFYFYSFNYAELFSYSKYLNFDTKYYWAII